MKKENRRWLSCVTKEKQLKKKKTDILMNIV